MKRFILALILAVSAVSVFTVPAISSVATTSNKNIYSTDGHTKVWDYTFPIIASTDIQVYVIDANGVQTQVTTDFSVSTLNKQVTYPVVASALATGSQVILLRSVPLTQSLTLTTQGPFPASSLNTTHDKLTMITQQLQEQLNRSLKGSITTTTAPTFPSPVTGYAIVWDSNGNFSNSNLSGPQGPQGPQGPAGSGTGDVVGPATNTDLYVPQWDGVNSKILKNGLAVGTSASNLVQLTAAAKLPAVDASLLTNVPTSIPSGVIVMWSGTIASIPTGWEFCNGSCSSVTCPDLRDRMIIGATSDSGGAAKTNVTGSLTVSGGSATHTISNAELPTGVKFSGGGLVLGNGGTAIESSNQSLGAGTAMSIINPYYSLAYIIKD